MRQAIRQVNSGGQVDSNRQVDSSRQVDSGRHMESARQMNSSSSGGVLNITHRNSVSSDQSSSTSAHSWCRLAPTRSRRLASRNSSRPASDSVGGRLGTLFSRRESPQLDVKVLARFLTDDAEPGYRPELVAQAKARIARGDYDSNDRIEAALDRMMRDLA